MSRLVVSTFVSMDGSEADGVQVLLTAQGEEFDGAEVEHAFETISASLGEA
jgi:hypothetical protein